MPTFRALRPLVVVFGLFALTAHVSADQFMYATDTNKQIVSINVATGTAIPYTGQIAFASSNALGYADNVGAAGSVIYTNSGTAGQLASWDRAANTHTIIGTMTATDKGYTNPYPTASGAPADAAYWGGGFGVPAGYYVVTSGRSIYRADIGTVGGSLAIVNVTLAGTVPTSAFDNLGSAVTLNNTFSFGDIAFDPSTGLLYLSDSSNGLVSYQLGATASTGAATATRINAAYKGQIAFGLDNNLYGVGKFNGTGVGSDLYSIDKTTGTETLIAANTDGTYTYQDLAGTAAFNVVPEPGTWAMVAMGALGLGALALRRRIALR